MILQLTEPKKKVHVSKNKLAEEGGRKKKDKRQRRRRRKKETEPDKKREERRAEREGERRRSEHAALGLLPSWFACNFGMQLKVRRSEEQVVQQAGSTPLHVVHLSQRAERR